MMELTFSPELPAWVCYLIVLVVALVAAARRVSTRLRSLTKKEAVPTWRFPRSWLLVLTYTAIPLVLFWLLDRMDAIHDTSLFAAVIVAVAFERILAGQHNALAVPESIGGFWNPFQAFVDSIADKVTKQMHRAAERFDREVLKSVADEQRFAALKQVALRAAPDVAKLEEQLSKIDSESGKKGPQYVSEIKARFLLEAIRTNKQIGSDAWEALLVEEKVIERSTYLRKSPQVRSRAIAVVGLIAIPMALYVGYQWLDRPANWDRYHLWRIGKTNTTDEDLHRTRLALGLHLADPTTGPRTYDGLIELLQQPKLPVERATRVLGLLLERRCAAAALDYSLQTKLIDALRTNNVDIRDRVNQALIYMAPDGKTDASLKEWNPTEEESVTEIERKIELWRTYLGGMTGDLSCNSAWREEPSLAIPIQPAD